MIACFANFLVASAFNLLMPTIPIYLSQELGIESSKIGVVLSSYAIALLLIRPFCGYWVDVYARKPLFLLGLTLFIATFIGYYFALTVLFFVILRFIHGLFWGLVTVSANTVAIDIIPAKRRAEGIGYFGAINNIGMAIAPLIGVFIYDEYGFNILIGAALVMGFFSILAALFIRVPIRKKLDEIPPISLDRFILVKAIPILINQIFLAFGWGTLVAFAVLYGKEIGIDNPGVFFLFLAVGIILSRVTTGKYVDRGHLHQIMVIALSIITMGFVFFAIFNSIYLFCFSAFVIGLGYGTLFPALQTIYINMAPASKRGTANSTYLTGFDLGIGSGMLISAYLAEQFGFSQMYLITAALCFISILIYWFSSKRVFEKHKIQS